MPRRIKKIKHSAEQTNDMRLHILTIASGLVMEKGVKETSLKDIAKAAGISKGTLYYYYSAKEDIIYDIADRNMSLIADELLAWIDNVNLSLPPEEILKEVFETVLEAETRGKLHLYLLNDAKTTNGSLAEKFQERYRAWRETLEHGFDKVLPQNKDSNAFLAYLVLAAMDGLIIQKMFGADEIPVEEIVKLILSVK